jgi:muramidase (phage lysozyme)
MLKFFEKAIKAGDFNQKNIDGWKDEIHPITKKRIGDSAEYEYLFGQLQLFLDKRKEEDAGSFEALKEQRTNTLMGETLRQIRTGELTISDSTVKELERKAFEQGIDSPRFTKMLEYIEDGLTVEDKAKDFLESELKTRLAQGEVIDDFEMLKYGQDLFNQYQSANEANKKNQSFQARKDLLKEGAAWLQQDETQPEGGGGLEITTTDSVKTQGQIRLLAEWEALLKQKFDQVLATARPEDDVYKTGTINGQSVKDTALALAVQDFEKLKKNPDSVFYKNPQTGTFSNTLKIKTGTGYVGTDAANKTYAEVTSKINTIQDLAKSTNQDYRSIVTNESLLSQVISKTEAIKMKSTIEKGKGIPAAILAIAALGGDGQLLTAQRIFNTYDLGNIEIPARNQQLAERLADPQFLSNFPVDEFMQKLGDIHRQGPREQQRTKDAILKQAAAAEGIEPPGVERVAYIAAQQVTPEARALLRTLMWAEGTDKRGSRAYGTHYGYEYTPPTGNHPDRVIHKDGISSAAYGAYQFMPQTWAGTSFGRQGMPMTPENQDLAALELVRQRRVNPDRELTTQDWDRLTPEWASIPHSTTNRGIYAGQRGKTLVDLNRVYKQFLREERYNQRIRGLI